MAVDRVKFQDIVESQFPRYVLEDFPLLPEFIKQYYKSQEYQGGTLDLVQNIDKYVKVDELFSLKTSTQLNGDLDFTATTIPTSSLTNFTEGFPETNGLIKIDQEIIHYESISNNSFINCTRGFSGITTYVSGNQPDQLTFNQTEATEHADNTTIQNLNVIFLQDTEFVSILTLTLATKCRVALTHCWLSFWFGVETVMMQSSVCELLLTKRLFPVLNT